MRHADFVAETAELIMALPRCNSVLQRASVSCGAQGVRITPRRMRGVISRLAPTGTLRVRADGLRRQRGCDT